MQRKKCDVGGTPFPFLIPAHSAALAAPFAVRIYKKE